MPLLPTAHRRLLMLSVEQRKLRFGTEERYQDALRFCNRYRVAASFEGLILRDFKNDTTAISYGAIFRAFLAYTAYELLLSSLDMSAASGATLSENRYGGARIRSALERHKHFDAFLTKLRDVHDFKQGKNVREKISRYLAKEETMKVVEIGKAVRNAFSHGRLASTFVGASPKSVKAICDEISAHILSVCDGELTAYLQ